MCGLCGGVLVFGTDSRGGGRALIDMAHVIRRGTDAALAIDGPRGPAYRAKPGIIVLAKVSQRPIVPVVTTAKHYWQFQSWDRFRLPLPFTWTMVTGANPIHVPRNADGRVLETKRAELERTMLNLQKRIDEEVSPRVFHLPDRRPCNQVDCTGRANPSSDWR